MPAAEKITHEKIIKAVLDSSFVSGAGATSLSDIAGKLGIKKASLYNHFESRDAIIDATELYCEEQLAKTAFVPSDMNTMAVKYSAEAVFKGLVNRWFKLNEKEPLIQIFSFIESEKYFSTESYKILHDFRQRLIDQSLSALKSLVAAGKIKAADDSALYNLATLFVATVRELLDTYIIAKKNEIRTNPESGEGNLFSLPASEPDFSATDRLIDQFCALLK